MNYIICLFLLGIINFTSGIPWNEDSLSARSENELSNLLKIVNDQGKFDISLSHHEDSPQSHHEDRARIFSRGYNLNHQHGDSDRFRSKGYTNYNDNDDRPKLTNIRNLNLYFKKYNDPSLSDDDNSSDIEFISNFIGNQKSIKQKIHGSNVINNQKINSKNNINDVIKVLQNQNQNQKAASNNDNSNLQNAYYYGLQGKNTWNDDNGSGIDTISHLIGKDNSFNQKIDGKNVVNNQKVNSNNNINDVIQILKDINKNAESISDNSDLQNSYAYRLKTQTSSNDDNRNSNVDTSYLLGNENSYKEYSDENNAINNQRNYANININDVIQVLENLNKNSDGNSDNLKFQNAYSYGLKSQTLSNDDNRRGVADVAYLLGNQNSYKQYADENKAINNQRDYSNNNINDVIQVLGNLNKNAASYSDNPNRQNAYSYRLKSKAVLDDDNNRQNWDITDLIDSDNNLNQKVHGNNVVNNQKVNSNNNINDVIQILKQLNKNEDSNTWYNNDGSVVDYIRSNSNDNSDDRDDDDDDDDDEGNSQDDRDDCSGNRCGRGRSGDDQSTYADRDDCSGDRCGRGRSGNNVENYANPIENLVQKLSEENQLQQQLSSRIKKYKINDELDAIVVDMSNLDRWQRPWNQQNQNSEWHGWQDRDNQNSNWQAIQSYKNQNNYGLGWHDTESKNSDWQGLQNRNRQKNSWQEWQKSDNKLSDSYSWQDRENKKNDWQGWQNGSNQNWKGRQNRENQNKRQLHGWLDNQLSDWQNSQEREDKKNWQVWQDRGNQKNTDWYGWQNRGNEKKYYWNEWQNRGNPLSDWNRWQDRGQTSNRNLNDNSLKRLISNLLGQRNSYLDNRQSSDEAVDAIIIDLTKSKNNNLDGTLNQLLNKLHTSLNDNNVNRNVLWQSQGNDNNVYVTKWLLDDLKRETNDLRVPANQLPRKLLPLTTKQRQRLLQKAANNGGLYSW